MKISKELQILIESIKIVIMGSSSTKLLNLVHDESIDWLKVQKMLAYHQLRPVFYEAANRIFFKNETVDLSAKFSLDQTVKNLNETIESARLLKLFADEDIPILPYKGLLFLDKMYDNKALRESGDMDLLVEPHNAVKALEILISDGYSINIKEIPTKEILFQLIETSPGPEVGLDKKNRFGVNVHIDFHWKLNEYIQYSIDLTDIFKNTEIGIFQRQSVLIPNESTIFKMLLNHHGGREGWVRLKDMADLIAFNLSYLHIKNADKELWSKELNMSRVNEFGHILIKKIFYDESDDFSQFQDSKTLNRILEMWEYSTHWDRIVPKIMLLKIYRRMQDKKTSWFSLLNSQIKFISQVNLIENKRIYVFPKQFVVLNAISKLLSYLIRVYLKPFFRLSN